MNCPQEIIENITQILTITLLRIRYFAGQRDFEQCFIEADHAHNLPDLIRNYSEDLLKFYVNISRLTFIQQSKDKNFNSFEPYWEKLEDILKRDNGT